MEKESEIGYKKFEKAVSEADIPAKNLAGRSIEKTIVSHIL